MGVEFSRLAVSRYRRLHEVSLELKPLNVMIGANGCGKTSVLEVMKLMAASARGRLQEFLTASGGVNSLLTHDGGSQLRLQLVRPWQNEVPLEYSLSLATRGLGYEISEEALVQYQRGPDVSPFKHLEGKGSAVRYFNPDRGLLETPDWEHQIQETALAQVPKLFKSPENFRRILASSTLYHALDVSSRAPVRLPQPMQPSEFPGSNGEELCSFLFNLSQTDPDRYTALEDALRAAFPGYDGLRFPPVAAGTITLAWKDRDFQTPFYPHQLSEGTLRFLWLTALLQSPQLPRVTMIDEPEVSLHPEMLMILVDLLREASHRTQIFVATHSDRLVRFLRPDELVVCDLDDRGHTQLTRASELDLDHWLENYSLDDLWSKGRLGGRA